MSDPCHILHVLSSLDETYGGPLRLVLDLSARAEGPSFVSEVLGVGELTVKDNPLEASRIHSVPAGRCQSYAYTPELRPWLRLHLPEFDGVVIHGAWTYPTWAAAGECVRAGIPYAFYPHGMLEAWAVHGQGITKTAKKLTYWALRERIIAKSARCILFTTLREQERTQPLVNGITQRRILRPYGMRSSPSPAAEPRNPLVAQPPKQRVALFLGRLHPKKNIEFLMQAWSNAGMKYPWRLVIAGSGDPAYEKKLRRVADSAGEPESIEFVGFVAGSDKRYLLQRADWFLLPSLQENFGVAVLEAVEQGCAVAISEQVYLAESFRRDSEILPLQVDAWTEFFRTRMQDQEWRNRVSRDDHAHLLKTFSMDRIVEQWTETFLDLFSQAA